MTAIDAEHNPETVLQDELLRCGVGLSTVVCIAFSGGADSTALLLAATQLRDGPDSPYYGLRLVALYLDHGIRPEPEREEEWEIVQHTCAVAAVELRSKRLEPGSLKRVAGGPGLEAAARHARYSFFAESVARLGAAVVLTAHHHDDQLETILLRFLRGAGPCAVGMLPFRRMYGVDLLRPWLTVPKSVISEYLQRSSRRGGYALRYVQDSSNSSLVFARNKLRHRVMPLLSELFPEYRNTVVPAAERSHRVAEFLCREAESRLRWRRVGRAWLTSREEFFALPVLLRIESLKQLCIRDSAKSAHTAAELPSSGFWSNLSEADCYQAVATVAESGVWRLRLDRDQILWERVIVLKGKNRYVLSVRENMRVVLGPEGRTVVSTQDSKQAVPACEIQLDAAALAAPLLLRTKRPGDSIQTGSGRKSVKKLLSEWKVSLDLRNDIPVLEDRNGLCAVVGEPLGYRNLVAPRLEVKSERCFGVSGVFRLWVAADGVLDKYAE